MTTIYIQGIPVSLKRVSEKSINGHHWRFDSQKKEKAEFRSSLNTYLLNHPETAEYLKSKEYYDIALLFGLPYPKSKLRKNTPVLETIPHTSKPDLDNLVKFVLDCGNELLWKDDKFITKIHARKLYVNEPKTIISIE
jgi:Holliday junction resolvase RusA-like endonuclease